MTADRRWAVLVPLATFVVAASALALVAPRGDGAAAGVPIAGVLAAATRAVDGSGALGRGLAIALVAAAATAVGAAVASARPGWSGRLAGAVAAAWMIATPPVRALAGAVTAATVAVAALAGLTLAIDRLARGGGAAAGRGAGVAAVAAVLVEARAWPALAVAAILLLYRARLGARWTAQAGFAAIATAVVALVAAAVAGGPRWATWPGGAIDPAVLVDELGPLALAIAAAGVATALTTRGDRWLVLALGATVIAGAPPAPPLGAGLPVALAIAVGVAVAELLARAPALRHQVVTAASIGALLAGAIAWA